MTLHERRKERERERKNDTAKDALLVIRLAAVIVVVSSLLLGASAYQTYTFDKRYDSHVQLAQSAGTPDELVQQLHEAEDGLNGIGYDTGQYAWVYKTPQTDTEYQRDILESHIERAEEIQSMEDPEQRSIAFLDYRQRLNENAPDVDTYGWWWRTMPFGVGIVFHPLVVMLTTALGVCALFAGIDLSFTVLESPGVPLRAVVTGYNDGDGE